MEHPTVTIKTEHRIVLQAAQRLHDEVVRLKGELSARIFLLGRALADMQASRAYTALGHGTFEDYLASAAVAIDRSTAYRLIRVAKLYGDVAHGRPWLLSIDLQKLDILGRLIDEDTDPAQIAALAEEARDMPREELRAVAQAEIARARAARDAGTTAAPATLHLRPTPPVQLLTGGHREALEELEAEEARVATDPAYQAAVLTLEWEKVHARLIAAAVQWRSLRGTVAPPAMAEALGEEGRERYRDEYETFIRPLVRWYEQAVGSAGLARVK